MLFDTSQDGADTSQDGADTSQDGSETSPLEQYAPDQADWSTRVGAPEGVQTKSRTMKRNDF